MLDARRLTVLRAIAEHGTFTRAAEALAMTQPAVSRQLSALEAEVGVALVARGPRHVSLTPAGLALLEDAHAILPAIDAATRRLRAFAASDGGAVRLGAVPSAMAAIVPDAVRALRAQRARVEIQLEEGWSTDLIRRTARGDFDLAVVSTMEPIKTSAVLLREPFVALLPADHPLARRRTLALRDLAGQPWIVAPEPSGREAVVAACARAGFAPRVVASATWYAAEELIAVGLAVALAPECTTRRLRLTDAVAARHLTAAPVRELLLVKAPRRERTPVELDLAEHLRAAAERA
jgi:DNA-binding transcriptional LysR family regulator